MSDTTRQAVEDAIATHVADEKPGAYLTGYVVMAAAVLPEDDDITNYQSILPATQPLHVSLGLATILADNTGEWIDDEHND
jgi:hypothetical protein